MTGRLKLLLIWPLPPPLGGATVSFQHLLVELRSRSSLEIKCIDSKSPGSRLRRGVHVLRVLFETIRHIEECDVVSVHTSPGSGILFGLSMNMLPRFRNKRIVLRLFGGGIHDIYLGAGSLTRRLIRRSLKVDCLLLQSTSLAEFFRRELPGTDVHWFPTSRPRRPPPGSRRLSHPVRLLLAGHIREDKGVGVALGALRALRIPAELHVFGRPEDRDLVRAINSEANAFYHGELSPARVLEAMENFHLLVMPTYYDGEGYPGIIIEAFSRGLPVVATEWKYIPELVEHGVNGLLVPPRNEAALAEAIDTLASDEPRYCRFAAQAYERSLLFDSGHWNGRRFLELIVPGAGLGTSREHWGEDPVRP